MNERRQESRQGSQKPVFICWRNTQGMTQTATERAMNISPSGLAFHFPAEVDLNTLVYIAESEASTACYSRVRHCTWNGTNWVVGVELDANACQSASAKTDVGSYYDFLQISPAAQPGTIHRVFRYLAGLYHPDNPDTGDPERFLQLNRAYEVLSNEEKRAAYDEQLNGKAEQPSPAFTAVDYMDGVEGELNRRLAVLAVLYRKCRSNIHDARVTLIQLEQQMGFPREYLDFTTWYLRSKKYITREDNSDFALTAAGVDFVEENFARIPLLQKLLGGGISPEFRSSRNRSSSPAFPVSGDRPVRKALTGIVLDGSPSQTTHDMEYQMA